MTKYYVTYKDVKVGEYQMIPMPGCKVIGILCRFQIYPEFRGKGYASALHPLKLQFARDQGYKKLVCTTVSSNIIENKILRQHEWKEKGKFYNSTTGNIVIQWERSLDDPYEELYSRRV